jgi:hypothetical protein
MKPIRWSTTARIKPNSPCVAQSKVLPTAYTRANPLAELDLFQKRSSHSERSAAEYGVTLPKPTLIDTSGKVALQHGTSRL